MLGAVVREVVICTGVRTPRGKGTPRGALQGVSAVKLVADLLAALDVRSNVVDDVVLGCATQIDSQGGNLARAATLLAGWDVHVPGVTINRFCASGIDAVNLAAARVRAGDVDLVVAGGVESVSNVPAFGDRGPLFTDPAVMARSGSIHMGSAADLVATLDGVRRDQLDDYAEASRAKARAAWASGVAASSVVPVVDAVGNVVLARDELLTGAPSRSDLDALAPIFADRPSDDAIVATRLPPGAAIHHVHTRGNSPALADAASVMIVAERGAAERAGLMPRARIVTSATCAADPVMMLTAGQAAAENVLLRAGIASSDVSVFEFAEAFAALCLRFMRDLDVGHDRLNPNGGTIALGHAFGATGAILLLNAVDELARRQSRYAVVAVSGAAGLGAATLLERVS